MVIIMLPPGGITGAEHFCRASEARGAVIRYGAADRWYENTGATRAEHRGLISGEERGGDESDLNSSHTLRGRGSLPRENIRPVAGLWRSRAFSVRQCDGVTTLFDLVEGDW